MIPIRYQTGEPREKLLDHALPTDHPLVGYACPGCDGEFAGGERIALVYVGPGANPETQAEARRELFHTGAAVALHAACAGIET